MANILILDVGNSNTKCYVFQVNRTFEKPYGKYEPTQLYEEIRQTNRGHPWDLVDTCRNMVQQAIEAHKPEYGMIISFGDGFVHHDPDLNYRPRFVFADEPVPEAFLKVDVDYKATGFPLGNIQLTGVRPLRQIHNAAWKNIVPVNIFVGKELTKRDKWRGWDITQASATGEYNLWAKEWLSKGGIPVCLPSDEIGVFEGMPILAGGMDQGFVDTTEATPYIVAGTWLVVSAIHDQFTPTPEQYKRGVRWYISGNGKYLSQTVRKSEKPMPRDLPEQILSDFQAMGLSGGDYQKIRVFGGYGEKLLPDLQRAACGAYFDFQFVPYAEEHRQAAIYVYKHKEDTLE